MDGTKNKQGTTHECTHEKDWIEIKSFKDRVLEFMGAKEATNGALKEADNSLEGRLTRIENKVDTLMLTMLSSALAAIVALVVAVIALIR